MIDINIRSGSTMQDIKVTFILALLASLTALSAAYFMEYGIGLLPCRLCFIQRRLYYLIIALSSIGIYGLRKDYLIRAEDIKQTPHQDFNLSTLNVNKPHSSSWAYIYRYLCYFVILLSFVGVLIGGFQFGVEKKVFRYNSSCSLQLNDDMTLEEFQEKIVKADLVSCDMPQGELLGISVAGWNCLYSLVLFIILLMTYKKKLPKYAYTMMHKLHLIH